MVEEHKPLPREWIIGGVAASVLLGVAILYGSLRAWRSSNVFGRQYRFPVSREAALRLGALKSGGHLATVQFGPRASPPAAVVSEAKQI